MAPLLLWLSVALVLFGAPVEGQQRQQPSEHQAATQYTTSFAPSILGMDHTGKRVTDLMLRNHGENGLVLWFYPKAGTGG